MEVILLERIAKLGQMGEKVRVKNGFARNFLLPKGKALRATEANVERFENERAQLEARNLEQRQEAEFVAENLNNSTHVIIRQSGESGHLYGSVTTRNIADLLTENGVTIQRNQVSLQKPVKTIGLHSVDISLHPEVEVSIKLNVARTEEEAERQAAGEILVGKDEDKFEFNPGDAAEGEQPEDSDEAIAAYFDNPPETKSDTTDSPETTGIETKEAAATTEKTSQPDSKSSKSQNKDAKNSQPKEEDKSSETVDKENVTENSAPEDSTATGNSSEEPQETEPNSESDSAKK